MATTVTTSGVTFPDSTLQTTAYKVFGSFFYANTTGSWVVPAGVTKVLVALYGGGGGGGSGAAYNVTVSDVTNTYQIPGGNGGFGGGAISVLDTIPGTTINFTIGAGGTGSNGSSSGSSGGTSTLTYATTSTSLTATGGSGGGAATPGSSTPGTTGTQGTGNGEFNNYPASFVTSIPLELAAFFNALTIASGESLRVTGNATPLTWTTSLSPRYLPGAPGQGESTASSSDANGGLSGGFIVAY